MAGTGEIFFHQSITSISSVTRDKWGDTTTTSVYTNVSCRFTYDVARTRGITEDQPVDALAYINPSYTIQPDYLVVFSGSNYRVIKVFHEYDLFGNIDHIKLTLKSRD
jgi:hypothetical protein